MRKIVIHRPGGYERLEIEEHPDPSPGEGEVLVAAAAAGVNFADCAVRMGLYRSAREFVGWPITPGFEFAGTVAAVGRGVADLAPAARVFGVSRFGAYATHVVVPRHQLFAVPVSLTFEQAAGFPSIFLTAYFPLFELTRVRVGMSILVHSAAGGVGSALVQLGKVAGCRVVGVVGASHKVDAVRELGADAVIDKSREDLWRAAEKLAPGGFDVVLDANGAATLRGSYGHLAPAGRLVAYGFHSMLSRGVGRPNWFKLAWDYLRTPRFHPLEMTSANKSVLAFNLSYLFPRADLLEEAMGRLLGWLREGKIRPPRITTYPLDQAAEAHRALESAQTVGKLVLLPR